MPFQQVEAGSRAPQARPRTLAMLYYLRRIFNFLLFGFIFLLCLGFIHQTPPFPNEASSLWKTLLRDDPVVKILFKDPGTAYSMFRPYLPSSGSVGFLTDPMGRYDTRHAIIQAAQGYFAPLLVNMNPTEKLCIVYCSNDAMATAQMNAAGYRMTIRLGDGLGIAEKIP